MEPSTRRAQRTAAPHIQCFHRLPLEQGNPFDVKSLYRKSREENNANPKRMSFTREQQQALLDVLEDDRFKLMHKPEVRVVYYLGMFTGQRTKDCILLTWDRVNMERRRIWVRQFKTGKEVSIPMAQKLHAVLQEARSRQCDHYVTPNVARRYSKTNALDKNVGNNLVNIDKHYTHVGDEAQEQAINLISGSGDSIMRRHEKARGDISDNGIDGNKEKRNDDCLQIRFS